MTRAGSVDRLIGVALPVMLCLAVSPVGSEAQAPGVRAVLPGLEAPILLDSVGIGIPIAGRRDSIYAALVAVFDELKIPVAAHDASRGLLQNVNASVSRRLGGEVMSKYLDCGRGFSGSNADFYRITLAVSAWVEPATGAPERLVVAIAASGRDPAGSKSAYSACTSRGALEARIARQVQARMASP